ncbi:MAG: hypothetical protein OXI13_00810 [Gammaproteobacteria bacterium]|nr:hypothetical protein [Gammaproteobacteria bacterium]
MKQHAKVVARYSDKSKKYLSVCGKWFDQKYFERTPNCRKCLDAFNCKRQVLNLKPARNSKTSEAFKENDPAKSGELADLPIAA